MPRRSGEKTGICKLTGQRGNFVRSHLIPAALTRPEYRGAPLIQPGPGPLPIRRWTSWYDRQLVTSEGEALLQSYDGRGIAELQRHRLIWSSWGPMIRLSTSDHRTLPGNPFGIRKITGVDSVCLRLFFLSLLWRAASTRLKEFTEITIERQELERLQEMLLRGKCDPLNFYPMHIVQLSTIGVVHNLSPFADEKIIPAVGDLPSRKVKIFRFYFDGLIIHFHRPDGDPHEDAETLSPPVVGFGPELLVSTVTFESSFQATNLMNLKIEAQAKWRDHSLLISE